jgi:putative ABC transport system permease protein
VIQRAAADIAANAAIAEVVPFQDVVSMSVYSQKVAASLLTVLGAVAVLLAALGLYSVLAYVVTQRQHEFGIRLALGAGWFDVVRLVLRQGLLLTAAGILCGIAMASLLMPLAASVLVGTGLDDPLPVAGSAVFLTLVALLASYLPARRATKVDPMVTLREP